MRLVITSLFVFLFTTLASANSPSSCGERLKASVSGQKVQLQMTQAVYSLAAQALRHYRQEIESQGAYIEQASKYVKNQKTVGYKITITNGGDESSVDYVLDKSGNLITGYWHNQSPVRFWFCRSSRN